MMRTFLRHSQDSLIRLGVLCVILLTVALVSQLEAGQERIKLERPVMMDSNGPGSELFVLDASLRLHELRLMQNNLQQYGSVPLPNGFAPADMTYASSAGQESLLIAGTESGLGVVVSYSLDGRPLKTWKFRNICSGIDFAPNTHSAYVATSDSNEIYQLDLRGAEITYVTRIENASKLGPVAFDGARRRIYVADVASGRIYEYSAATKTSKVMVTGFSAPTALAFDPETNRLFIADPGRRGIFTVDTRSTKPVAVELAPNSLKAPYGLALISENRLAVADYGANAVLVFSLKGELLFRFPSPD
jgi:DNA-binding beta-propeller fold protein YncE